MTTKYKGEAKQIKVPDKRTLTSISNNPFNIQHYSNVLTKKLANSILKLHNIQSHIMLLKDILIFEGLILEILHSKYFVLYLTVKGIISPSLKSIVQF